MSRLVALGVVVSVLLTVGCGSGGGGVERPAIDRPLDAGGFADRPCEVLPGDDAVRLGYPREGLASGAEAGDADGLAYCRRPEPFLGVSLFLARDELAGQYRESSEKTIEGTDEPWLAALTVGGQPAVTLGRRQGGPNVGCDVVVGLTDRQSLQVHAAEHQGDGRACEHAIAVAEAIVQNLAG